METPIIELKDIRKSFGPVEVLKGVDMKVYPGKVTALVGDNGAGKSTLIKGLSGRSPTIPEMSPSTARRSLSTRRATPPGTASRSSTRTCRCARTSTSSRTCSWGGKRVYQRMLNQAEMEKHATADAAGRCRSGP